MMICPSGIKINIFIKYALLDIPIVGTRIIKIIISKIYYYYSDFLFLY